VVDAMAARATTVYDPAGRAWLAAFLSHWLAQSATAESE